MEHSSKIPLIIDVDTGTDDAICIAAATLSTESVEILGFGTVCGNVGVDKTSQNTLNLVEFLNCPAPVHLGASKPLLRPLTIAVSHGATGLGDVVLPSAQRGFSPGSVADLLYSAAQDHRGSLEILAVGPLTNIATAFARYPELPSMIKRITIMGGGICGGNMTIASEFNLYCDPEAARAVFESGCSLVMIGLDVTLRPKLPDRVIEKVQSSPGRHADVVGRILDFMLRRQDAVGADEPNLHDVIAFASIVHPALFTFKDYYVHVETQGEITRGMTIADFHNVSKKPANARVAVDIDVDDFWQWFLRLFSEKRSQASRGTINDNLRLYT